MRPETRALMEELCTSIERATGRPESEMRAFMEAVGEAIDNPTGRRKPAGRAVTLRRLLDDRAFCPACGEPSAIRQFGDVYACMKCDRAGELAGWN